MAFGKPIIGVLDGDGKDILLKSGGSLVAEPNKESIADAINKMASLSDEERKRLGELNRAYYQNNLSIKRSGELINQILLDEMK